LNESVHKEVELIDIDCRQFPGLSDLQVSLSKQIPVWIMKSKFLKSMAILCKVSSLIFLMLGMVVGPNKCKLSMSVFGNASNAHPKRLLDREYPLEEFSKINFFTFGLTVLFDFKV